MLVLVRGEAIAASRALGAIGSRPKRYDALAGIEIAPVPCRLILAWDVHRALVAPRCARAQHVQAHPPDDRRQPGPHVLNGRGILVANPQPCLLQGVVGFADRSEHPIGDRPEMPSVLLEPFGQSLTLVHRQLRGLVMTFTSGCGRQRRW